MLTRETDLLAGISEALAAQILRLGSQRSFKEGETVFALGSNATELYLVEKGRVRLTLPMTKGAPGEEVFVEERVSGQLLGWSALVPPFRFTLKGTAAEETELISLPGPALLDFLSLRPEAGHAIMANLAGIIGQRLQLFQTMWVREIHRLIQLKAFEPQGGPLGDTP